MNNDLTLNDFIKNHSELVATMTANELSERFDKSIGTVYQCLKRHRVECKRQRNKPVKADAGSSVPLRAALWAVKVYDLDCTDEVIPEHFIAKYDNPTLDLLLDKLGPDEVKALRNFVGQPLTENQRKRELHQAEKAERLADIQKQIKKYQDTIYSFCWRCQLVFAQI